MGNKVSFTILNDDIAIKRENWYASAVKHVVLRSWVDMWVQIMFIFMCPAHLKYRKQETLKVDGESLASAGSGLIGIVVNWEIILKNCQ